MKKTKWTDEKILEEIRSYEKRLGHAPLIPEVPKYLSMVAQRHFGAWTAAVEKALGHRIPYHRLTPDETLEELRQLTIKYNRFPNGNNRDEITGNFRRIIKHHFGSFNDALEKALGGSPRTDVLVALMMLTGAKCKQASTYELRDRMDGHKNPLCKSTMSVHQVHGVLLDCKNDGYVAGGKVDRIALWSLTEKGKQFLYKFNMPKPVDQCKMQNAK